MSSRRLLDGGDSGEGEEEAAAIRKIAIGTRDRLARREVFRLEVFAVGSEDKSGLRLGGGRTGFKLDKVPCHFAYRTDANMDLIGLQDATGQVRLVRCA